MESPTSNNADKVGYDVLSYYVDTVQANPPSQPTTDVSREHDKLLAVMQALPSRDGRRPLKNAKYLRETAGKVVGSPDTAVRLFAELLTSIAEYEESRIKWMPRWERRGGKHRRHLK